MDEQIIDIIVKLTAFVCVIYMMCVCDYVGKVGPYHFLAYVFSCLFLLYFFAFYKKDEK